MFATSRAEGTPCFNILNILSFFIQTKWKSCVPYCTGRDTFIADSPIRPLCCRYADVTPTECRVVKVERYPWPLCDLCSRQVRNSRGTFYSRELRWPSHLSCFYMQMRGHQKFAARRKRLQWEICTGILFANESPLGITFHGPPSFSDFSLLQSFQNMIN